MRPLTLNLDGYGAKAELSLFADFVEWRVFQSGRPLGYRDIADYLSEKGTALRSFTTEPLTPDDSTSEDDDSKLGVGPSQLPAKDLKVLRANEDAARVGQMLLERQTRLGPRYPFIIDKQRKHFTVAPRGRSITPYHVLLSIGLSHACIGDRSMAQKFQQFTVDCFRARGFRTYLMGIIRKEVVGRGIEGFRIARAELAKKFCLRTDTNAKLPPGIQEEGVDALVRIDPVDDRAGCRTILVQATLNKCEKWYEKMFDPKEGTWRDLLGDPIRPLVTLALPHHVEDAHLHYLVDNGHGATIADRLRLVAHCPRVTAAQERIVVDLRARGVEW